MKILFFINELACGGKERRLTELLKALNNRPDCKFELAIMSNQIYYEEIFDLKIPIHYLIRKTRRDLSVFKMFYKLCENYKPDVVHCWDSMTAVYSVPVCKLLKIKLVNGLITNSPERQNIFNKHWLRAKITFPFSDIIIGNSKAGLMAYNAPESKSFVINNGFNFDRINKVISENLIRQELNIKTKYVIGMVASNTRQKDYETYFAAAQILLRKRKDITFLAIGENTDSDQSNQRISNEYTEYFRLLGKKFGVESYINAFDIGVLSTFTEGISNSILEYMALSKSVVATSGGGTNEIVLDRETGFLVTKSNQQELAEKIDMLLNDNELRLRMGIAGKERIQNHFSIDKMANNYISFYIKISSDQLIKRINIVKKFFREAMAFLMIQYYYISNSKSDGVLSIYFHNPSKDLFEKIIKWLVAREYRFISIKELDSFINNKQKHPKQVFISFDDGWKGNIELVESIEKYKVPVTIFIATGALKEGNYWWEYSLIKGQGKYSGINKVEEFKKLEEDAFREKLEILKNNYFLKRSCITLEELEKMSENEFITIGSHTVTHPILIRCSVESQTHELKESKRILTQWLNKEIKYLAYPNGDYNEETIEAAKKCGYSLGFTTNPGRIDVGNVHPFIIPRNALYDSGGYYENIAKILGIWQKFIFSRK